MATTKKTATKKAAPRKKKLSPNTKILPPGVSKVTINLPTKLVNALDKRAQKIKAQGKQNGDGRWGYQSLVREILEKEVAKFK